MVEFGVDQPRRIRKMSACHTQLLGAAASFQTPGGQGSSYLNAHHRIEDVNLQSVRAHPVCKCGHESLHTSWLSEVKYV